MNSTNRVVNRLFLIVVGAALLAAGLAAIAVAVLPQWTHVWRSTAPSVADLIGQSWRVGVAFAGIPQVPWLLLLIPVAALVAIVLLLVLIFAQGRGRSPRVVESRELPSAAKARLTVDTSIAGEAIRASLAGERDVAAVAVSAYRVKGTPALKITVTPRRGAAPGRVLARTEHAVAAWDELLGIRIPVFIHLQGGARAAVARSIRTT